ncbi:nuclear transport factor 2 family protein [Nocardia bhagyanarayanae]|uniref:Low molecular weight antigen MTB12-like C-terminal domain-containing protein n=1 Tax=Nocardia bhagyanarayanae TaxID=1215925 RepID=A0A543FEF1_9NOCA|nr:nuclear transport factor 2 family protein [Nocardia bhagyanarayanae]TQM32248.1 hypothetical protein FB390_3926 [Nocardia bhagyanarayanae]
MLLPAKTLRLSVATAAAALAVTVGLTACGSDDSSETAATTTAAAATTTAATTGAAGGHDHAGEDAPKAEELQATLALVADPSKPTAEKTAVIVDGEKRTANIDQMNQLLAGYGQLTFAVTDVKTEGETATAQVVITSPHGSAPAMPMTWQHVDGKWKLSDATACTLLGFAQAPCTP